MDDDTNRALDATHIRFSGGEWALWKPVLLRAPGFPAPGLFRLAVPALAQLADKAVGGAEQEWTAYRQAFGSEIVRLSGELQAIAREPDFQRALTWQNHHAVETGLVSFLRRRPDVDGRNKRYRRHEELVAKYWQRYCVKNDTVGFFGPVGWGRFDANRPFSDVGFGRALVSRSEVFFETWAVDKLAATIDTTAGIRKWLAPRVPPFVRLDVRSALVPGMRPISLSEEESTVLAFCDGVTAAWRIADQVLGTCPGLSTEQDVFTVIESLSKRRIVVWRLEIPVSLWPERELRRLLSQVEDMALASAEHAKLDRLEAARDEVRRAAGDPSGLATALGKLDRTFTQITGAAPTRNHGKVYGGRTLVYHDALRDIRLVMGRDFLDALKPLKLLLTSARWLTHRIGRELTARLHDLVDQHVKENQAPATLAWLWMQAMPLIHRSNGSFTDGACAEFQRRWMSVLDCPVDVASAHYDFRDLAPRVADRFAAPRSGWTSARYCSPDIMVAARDIDGLERGDFTLVLGEFHLAINTLRSAAVVAQHPFPEELHACVAAEDPAPRMYPVLPKDSTRRVSARTQPALIRESDFLVALFDQSVDPARPRLLRAAGLVVEQSADRLWVTAPGGYRFDVMDAFSEMLMNMSVDKFRIFDDRPHMPRVSIDKLVISRETWTFSPDLLMFATEDDEATRFAKARRWRRDNSLPERVFVKVPGQEKPFYIDFESPIFVNVLAKSVRAARSGGDAAGTGFVHLTEMLPSMENLWLSDGTDRRYTSELRLTAVDLLSEARRWSSSPR